MITFICNQCYHITYKHPIYHGILWILKKIIKLRIFDNVRGKCQRCIGRAWRSCSKFLVCFKFIEKCQNYCKIDNIYELDKKKAKEITDQFSKEQAFIQIICIIMFIIRLIWLLIFNTTLNFSLGHTIVSIIDISEH